MIDIQVIQPQKGESKDFSNQAISEFLFEHLDQFGDPIADIQKCIQYAFDKGGFMVVASLEGNIVGAVIVNRTGMSGYIPENILVYIAVNKTIRGQGVGKKLMQAAIDSAEGAIALHVEPDNPARFLYEKIGFTNKYLEMRYQPKA